MPTIVGDSVEQVLLSKCLVNLPLALNYATSKKSVGQIVDDDKMLYSEAKQISELTDLTRAIGIEFMPTPGFDVQELIRLATAILSDYTHNLPTADPRVLHFQRLLNNWRS